MTEKEIIDYKMKQKRNRLWYIQNREKKIQDTKKWLKENYTRRQYVRRLRFERTGKW